jgi:hypothetical protein
MGPTSSWNADKRRLFEKNYYFQINIDSSLSLELFTVYLNILRSV